MPWDAHLNLDVYASVDFHVLTTKHLPKDDHQKSDASTPKNMLSAYKRILHPETGGCPPSNRIIQDIQRVIRAFRQVKWAKGCMIDEKHIARSGRRFETNGVSRRGGKRVKKHHTEYSPQRHEIHSDVVEVRRGLIEDAVKKFRGPSSDDDDTTANENIDINNASADNENENNEILENENL